MIRLQVRKILTDIRFWLIIFFLIRLTGITNAPLEIGHNWRQALTNMIARNFFENGVDLLRPAIDMAGEKSGIIGSEFPFFNFLIYLFAYIFDFSHWYGRLINLLVSTMGLYYFFRLIKDFFTKEIAFNATIILTTSIWFGFSRKIMPDTFSIALVIIGLYYGFSFIRKACFTKLILFFIFSTLGMLCKIPALALFSVIGIVVFLKEHSLKRRLLILGTSLLSVAIGSIWYFYWVPHLLETYRYQLYFPKGMMEGLKEILPLIPELLEKFYFSALHSYIGFTCFLIGIFFFLRSRQKLKIWSIGIISIVFILFIIKTGAVFPLHNYYIIPYSPIMALVAAFFIARIPLKYQYILVGLIAIEGIANQQHGFFIKDSETYRLKLEKLAGEQIPKNDLIIINGGQSPQDIYFANRKGWTINNEQLLNQHYLDSLNALGAKYLIIDRTSEFQTDFKQYQSLYQDEHYDIYKMEPETPGFITANAQ